CLSLDDGAEIWNYAYPVKIKRNHGMSRTVPAVTEKHIVTLGPKCHVHCLDPVTGQFYWMIDLVKEYQTVVPPWYAGQCPLIDGERVILAPGGSALLIAVDGASGKVLWQTPNPDKWDMTHSSIIPMTFQNKKVS
ncbi:MAG TPA: PQQ-binding-like beta-propeller repeat protein, partial [Aquaticitalea sp.]|nr:PQQ-binding-like beta-propeller repeat protein [Aquaticitalea sp.]